jgi:large repetitive protein
MFRRLLSALRRPKAAPRRTRLWLEALESRCVPTVTTSASAGILTITGSGIDNHVTVTESATQGSYTVSASDGVSGSTSFTSITGIAIDLQGQSTSAGDTADFVGNAGANAFLSGTLSVTGAAGLKVGFQSNFNVQGAVSVTKTTNTGGLTVKTGATSAASVFAAANMTLGSATITNSGTGATAVNLQGLNAHDMTVRGALSVTMGSGANTFDLFNAAIGGGLTVSSAHAGVDPINLGSAAAGVNVGTFVSLNGTNAASGLNVTADGAVIGTFFSVASGSGTDTVTVDRTSVLGIGLLPQQQTFGVDLKGGTNTSKIGTAGPDAANVVHGSLFHFGAGTEKFTLTNYLISSFVTVNAQAGNAGVTASITDSNISNFLSFAAAGSANDSVTVDNLSIGQNFALDLGGGTNTSTITDNHYLGSYSEIDAGIDAITFTGNTGFGNVTFTAGRLTINTGTFVNDRIAGSASFTSTGNTDQDQVILGPSIGTAVDTTNAVAVGKALSVNVGSSTVMGDRILLNGVSVQTDVTIAAAVTTAGSFTITNATVGGDLSVNAGTSTAALTVFLGSSTLANTGAVTVGGDLTITTGSLNDAVFASDTVVGGTTVITTGAGVDQVNLEAIATLTVAASQFFGAVTVSVGDNNDFISLGFSATNQARFLAAVTLDGGGGSDTLTETAVQYLGGPPTKISIP